MTNCVPRKSRSLKSARLDLHCLKKGYTLVQSKIGFSNICKQQSRDQPAYSLSLIGVVGFRGLPRVIYIGLNNILFKDYNMYIQANIRQ